MELKELLDKIESHKNSMRDYKRLLKTQTDQHKAAELSIKVNSLEMELDNLTLMKVQHDLISYINDGGTPVIKDKGDNLYQVSIPGSTTAAFVNQEGLKIVQNLMNGISITDEDVRTTNEGVSDTVRVGSSDPT